MDSIDFSNPVEVVDPTKLKIVTNKDGICLFISRAPIPFPKGDMNYVYQKFVGVGAFTHKALEYYHDTPPWSGGKNRRERLFPFYRKSETVLLYQCPLQNALRRHPERPCRRGTIHD